MRVQLSIRACNNQLSNSRNYRDHSRQGLPCNKSHLSNKDLHKKWLAHLMRVQNMLMQQRKLLLVALSLWRMYRKLAIRAKVELNRSLKVRQALAVLRKPKWRSSSCNSSVTSKWPQIKTTKVPFLSEASSHPHRRVERRNLVTQLNRRLHHRVISMQQLLIARSKIHSKIWLPKEMAPISLKL